MKPKLVAVVARARNNVIGVGNGLPWRLSSDLKHYKARTWGRPMIMGRKTWESIGRPLPGRESVVVTRRADFEAPGGHVEPASTRRCGSRRGSRARWAPMRSSSPAARRFIARCCPKPM
jgi:dihydrofolate reductase